MYKYIKSDNGEVGLHDCRVTHMDHIGHILSFDFPEGFYILNQKGTPHFRDSRMECHIIDEDIDGIMIFIYRETAQGEVIREDWSDRFISAINSGIFEFEFVTTYQCYQHILFKGYVWFDNEPYNLECEIELHTDSILYMWND